MHERHFFTLAPKSAPVPAGHAFPGGRSFLAARLERLPPSRFFQPSRTASHAMPALATSLGLTRCRHSACGEAGPQFPAIASLVARWEADQIVPAAGVVATWPDLSGSARHLTQATAAARPAYTPSDPAFNGQPSVTFDGVNDTLANLSMPQMGTAITIIDVLKVTNPMPGFGILAVFYNSNSSAAGPGNICGFYGDQVYQIYLGAGSTNVASRTYLTTPFISRMEFSSTICRHQVTGAAEVTGTSGTLVGANTVRHYMASNGGSSGYVPCTIAARFMFGDVLSAGDLDALLEYIGTKYGVAL